MKYVTERHKLLVKKLKGLNTRRTDITKNNIVVAKALGVSHTTVINYLRGMITDPYLAEDIISLVEKEISNKNNNR